MTFATLKVNLLAWYHNCSFFYINHDIIIIMYITKVYHLYKKITGGRTYCSRVQTWRMLSHVH
jgi:hypothetical protein